MFPGLLTRLIIRRIANTMYPEGDRPLPPPPEPKPEPKVEPKSPGPPPAG